MAGYDGDWQNRSSGWSGWRGNPGGRGYRQGRGDQPWASRRPRNWSGMQGNGYGVEYNGRAWPYGTGYRPGSESNFGPGYDFGYQGGEWGRPVNERGFGTRASYGPPEGRGRGGWTGRDWRAGAYNAAYGRDYTFGGSRGGFSRGYLRGRGTEYGADFSDLSGRRGIPGPGAYGGDYDRELGRPRGPMGSGDFAGREDRHYGRTPVDRWPAHGSARPDARMDDDDVRESVRENLFQDSFINPDHIEVEVERGVVTLRGELDDFLQARYAWDDAWESPGVRGVINNLTVRTDRASDEMEMPQTQHGQLRE